MSYFDKLSREKARSVVNALVEAPFFYRTDDEELFLYLRRHKADFERFFAESFGWELMVDARCARLYKSRWHNRALKPSQHDVFDPTSRNGCLAFLLVLEFYEHLLDRQNLAVDDADSPRFYYGELFEFACARLREELGDAAPREGEVRKLLRDLVDGLLRYRLLREIPPEHDDGEIEREQRIYEGLPGLRCYDVRKLGPGALAAVLGQGSAPASTPEESP